MRNTRYRFLVLLSSLLMLTGCSRRDIIWANSGRYNFIGPTKAKVSLVWLITKRRR